jgi:hypothetical protein
MGIISLRAREERKLSRKPDKKYRPKKLSTLDPGMILEAIDNEEIVVIDQGKRKRMTRTEIYIRQLFSSAFKGDMKAARQVVDMAAEYLAPDQRNQERHYHFIGETEAIERYGPNWREKVDELNALAGY